MMIFRRFQDYPLRTQLMFAFAVLSIATTAISTITLASLSGQRMHAALRGKSNQYARQLQRQLETVVAFDDKLTARELFQSLAEDRDVDGVAVYAGTGALIEGWGRYPPRLTSNQYDVGDNTGRSITLAPVKSREGPSGLAYVSLTDTLLLRQQRHEAWIAGTIGAVVVLGALLLAIKSSGHLSLRLVRISDAAKRMAYGDLKHASLDESAKDEVGSLAHAFNTMVTELSRLSAEHEALVSTERERLEQIVLDRTRALEQSREMFRLMAESTRATPFTLDLTVGSFPYIGAQAIVESGVSEELWRQPHFLDAVLPRDTNSATRNRFEECAEGPFEFETQVILFNVRPAEMKWTGTCELSGESKMVRGLMQDVTDVRRMERELAASQKLESVGRLAAGVAHEINTPIQFVADNVRFIETSIADIASIIDAYGKLQQAAQGCEQTAAELINAKNAESRVDLNFIMENLPPAVASATEGLERIATIVRSMKQFAHPDTANKTYSNLTQGIQSTLVIANSEFKAVADLETQFDDLPLVLCHLGEINQVVLNLIVNASHAIDDVVRNTGQRGKLTVTTRNSGSYVEISVSDTGTGIPESARDKIFDPFFTTKEVGKGTGQGLALAHNVIVKKHGGTLRFETESGKGTTFTIRLPVNAPTGNREPQSNAA